jgi:thiamine phosphate synthase YjbQ (UPF0047 family)
MLMGEYTYRLHVQAHVPVTGGRFDFGTWEQIFQGQAEWLARES